MTPAENLIARLQRVRRTGPGRWIASSPTREDKHPSLAIRELDDGRVLIHDFGGDNVGQVLAAVGLGLADLYPRGRTLTSMPMKRPFNAADVLALVAFEASVAVVVCSDVLHSRNVSSADFDRLLAAAQRLSHAAEVCHVYR